jgi:hypothetical protein
MGAICLPDDRPMRTSYAVGILVAVLFWLTGCQGLQKQQAAEPAVDPFHQSGPVGTAPDQVASKPAKKEKNAVANAAVPAPKTTGTVTSAAVPVPKGPSMVTPGGSAAKLLPPDTLSPGTATLVSGGSSSATMDDKASATLQPLQQAEFQGGGQTMTIGEALRQVQLRNVTAQKLEQRGGKWCFSCEVPAPTADDPKASKLYEAEADKDVDAVQAVLARIDQDQPRK